VVNAASRKNNVKLHLSVRRGDSLLGVDGFTATALGPALRRPARSGTTRAPGARMFPSHLLIACPNCEPAVAARTMFFNAEFWSRAFLVAAPVVCVALAILLLKRFVLSPLTTAGVLLGTGLGGFIDGILLHQMLQWHNMLSSLVEPTALITAKYNMIWDGVFHTATWVFTFAGVIALFRAVDRNWRSLAGGMLGGWGLFNAIEGVIDHQLLQLHHVHPGAHELAWDLGFILFGLGLMAAGVLVAPAQRGDAQRPKHAGN